MGACGMVEIIFTRVSEALSRSRLPDLDYALNPYVGCMHRCIYCYARDYTRDRNIAEHWGEKVAIKINLLRVLEKEIRSRKRGVVGLSTITDPYQPIEGKFALTRRALELLLSHGFEVSIQTKSDLVLRDLDILAEHRSQVDVGFTITTLDQEVARAIEPVATPPRARARALSILASEGLDTWVFLGPIIPGLNDDEYTIEEIVRLAAETSGILYYDRLRIKRFMIRSSGKILGKALKLARNYDWRSVYRMVERLCERYHVTCRPAFEGSIAHSSRRITEFF